MATRSAGRVTIRVIPDSTEFRRDLKTALERVEKTLHAEIPARLTLTRESIAELKAQIRDLEVRLKVNPYLTREDLHKIKDDLEDLDPNINVGVNTLVARARLAALARPRTATIFVKVNKASAITAARTLAALSGGRLGFSYLDKFWDFVKNLDKAAPKLALVSTLVTGLGGSILALISNASGLAASVAQIGQAAILLPALFTGAGISIAVLVAAFKDMKTVLKDLGPSFTNLQDIISKRFWSEAAEPIRDMVHTLMPSLNHELGELSQAWGRLFANLAKEIKAAVTPEELARMMGNLTRAVDIASGAMRPLVQAFNTLGSFGSQYLPRLSTWLVKLSEDFNRFVTDAATDGRLEKWAENGIKAIKDLGRVIRETVRVFAALADAAALAGGSTLGMLADGLKRLADQMARPQFQTPLATIFFGAHAAMDGLVDGLERLGPGLANFSVTIARVFSSVGKALGQLGEDLGALLSNPSLQAGIETFFGSIVTFFTDLKPAMDGLGRIIGTIGDIAGTFLSNFGPVISTLANSLAPVFEEVWRAVKPLVPVLTDLLIEIIPPLAEILMVVAKEILPPLIPLIKELAPIFADLVKAASPVLVAFLKDFGEALKVMTPFLTTFASGLKDVTGAFKGLPLAFYQYKTGDNAGFIGTMIKFMKEQPEAAAFLTGIGIALTQITKPFETFAKGTVVTDFLLNLGAALTQPANIIEGVVNLAGAIAYLSSQKEGWDTFWKSVGSILSIITPIGPAFQMMTSFITAGVSVVTGLKPVWDGFWLLFHNPVHLAMQFVANTITVGMPNIRQMIVVGFAQIMSFWQTNWPTLIPTVIQTLGSIAGSVTMGFPGIVVAIVAGMIRIGQEWAKGWMNVLREIPGWFQRFGAGITAGIAIAVGAMMGLPPRLLGTLGGLAGEFFGKGVALLQNFAAGITQGGFSAIAAVGAVVGRIVAQLPGSPAKVGPLSGRGWSKIRGQHLVEDMAAGMKSRTGLVQTASLDIARTVDFGNGGASVSSVRSVAGIGDRSLVNIEGDYYGATPEAVADEFDKKVRRANLAAQIGKVTK